MKSANGSPNRVWNGRQPDDAAPDDWRSPANTFDERWGRSRLYMPRWQFFSVIAALALLAGIAFAIATDVVWALVFDQQTYCEGRAGLQQANHGADYDATERICDFWEW